MLISRYALSIHVLIDDQKLSINLNDLLASYIHMFLKSHASFNATPARNGYLRCFANAIKLPRQNQNMFVEQIPKDQQPLAVELAKRN